LITITGGKWTTYRRMAEDVVDHAEMVAGIGTHRCVTHDLPIHGAGAKLPQEDALAFYGSDAEAIREFMQTEPELAGTVHPRLRLTGAEIRWHVRREMARTVEDVLARRTRWLLLDAQASHDAAPKVAAHMAPELGWSQATLEHQIQRFQHLAAGYVLES
jgi:glycerol-3-phosphate dehydrogenase